MKHAHLGDYLLWEGKPAKIVGEIDRKSVVIELLEDSKCPHCQGNLGKEQIHMIVSSPLFQNNSAKTGEIDIRTYSNGVLHVIIGRTYGGEGYSGLTDGVDVRGKLTDIDIQFDSAIIWSDKLNMPCAVKLQSLYAVPVVSDLL